MSRILYGLLLIIGAGAVIVGGATGAFFNDTETSQGNIFTAGGIDLKVDHTRQTYNDNECTTNCVEVEGNVLLDNGFETPEVTHGAKWEVFDSPVDSVWTVTWRDDVPATFGPQNRPDPAHLELHEGVLGLANQGDQYAELDSDWGGPNDSGSGEPASIKIAQTISTTPGTKYKLYFAFAPRPNTPANDNTLEVRWDGNVVLTIPPTAGGAGPIAWTEYELSLPPATTNSTELSFMDLGTANSVGTFLDDVKLVKLDCVSQTIVGGQCLTWDEKDLGEGDRFWFFNDVKPGDRGTNVISLHVYDNDAFACVLTGDVADDENTLIEPEEEADDTTPGNPPGEGEGELAQYLKLFIWEDDNDGVYENSEDTLYGPNAPFTEVAMEKLSLTATTTSYLGVAWCFGEQSLDGTTIECDGTSDDYNDSQTDSVTASLIFDAVQQRNNGEFECRDLLLDEPFKIPVDLGDSPAQP